MSEGEMLTDGGTIETIYNERDEPVEARIHDDEGSLLVRIEYVYNGKGQLSDERLVNENLPLPKAFRDQIPPEHRKATLAQMLPPRAPARTRRHGNSLCGFRHLSRTPRGSKSHSRKPAGAAERFRQEARAAASFAHPNVVTVYNFGVAAGTRAFLVMAILEGSTLREVLQKRFTPAGLLTILDEVGAALGAAYRRHLVHRDIKPENLFLATIESCEVAKVLDFGLVKFVSNSTEQ